MKTTLLLASLVLGSFTAAGATPTPPTPPGPPPPNSIRVDDQRCKATGDVLFEIDHRVVMDSPMENAVPTSELVLYKTGAWTLHSGTGKAAHTSSGCLDERTLKTIQSDLEHATWTHKMADAACEAISNGYVAYSSHGKLVWTQRMCQLEYLDDTSRRSLDEIEKLLVAATAPHTPPCCKK
jgi:hypothetical protein